ncbi:hypothetical protein NGC49_05480 [Enterobacter vonholyi]|uniref:hypothetical protein n=1 Tax=Enterobacter vonholyi TaxID=2797505 RepID=UPI000E27DC31|nr:hypothetical protein [Enterobacter vonholyi]MEB7623179.1 hypothetical protein [Enterobacter vonholyi]
MDFVEAMTKAGFFLLGIAVVFVVPKWASAVITYATKHKYDELIESIKKTNQALQEHEKNAREVRMKAVLISELLAEWVTKPAEKKRLRELTFEAFLWLPKDLAVELSKLLTDKPDSIGIRAFLVRVRVYLGVNDGLEDWRIVTFGLSEKEKKG